MMASIVTHRGTSHARLLHLSVLLSEVERNIRAAIVATPGLEGVRTGRRRRYRASTEITEEHTFVRLKPHDNLTRRIQGEAYQGCQTRQEGRRDGQE